MINALIIDDEIDGAEVLQFLIEQNCLNVNVLGMAHSVNSAVNSIRALKPDVVFMDIEMPTGTGFDVLKATQDINYEVIFITAYEHYAIKAFKTNAIDYLLKPVIIDELINAIKKAEKQIGLAGKLNYSNQIDSLVLNNIIRNKKIAVPSQEGVLWIDIQDIIRFEAESNYTHVFIRNRKRIMIAKTLKSFEDQLQNTNFCRVHSAHLINLDEVERYIKGDGGNVILKDESSIPISRSHKMELLSKLNMYL
jgi:two-component system LytT family response regulator